MLARVRRGSLKAVLERGDPAIPKTVIRQDAPVGDRRDGHRCRRGGKRSGGVGGEFAQTDWEDGGKATGLECEHSETTYQVECKHEKAR
jgi:hypothetical protein